MIIHFVFYSELYHYNMIYYNILADLA